MRLVGIAFNFFVLFVHSLVCSLLMLFFGASLWVNACRFSLLAFFECKIGVM